MSRRPRTAEDDAAFQGLGRVITELRERRGMNRDEFAKKIGLERQAVQRLESGEVNASWGTLRITARALEIPLDSLIELAEESAPGKGGEKWRRWSRIAEGSE